MTLLRTLPLALALGLGLSACSPAESPASKSPPSSGNLENAKKLVAGASENKATAERIFEGTGGMVGVVVAPAEGGNGQKGIAWMSPDGTVLFPGPALNNKGENVTERFAKEQLGQPEKPDTSAVNKADLLKRAADASTGSFVQGKSGPVVTAIVDLNCSHCNTFFAGAQPLVDSGKLRVRYVLAGFLTSSSVPKAAAVLGAKDKVAAMKKAEADFAKNGQGSPAPSFKPEHEATVKANNDLLAATGEPSTPYLLYCEKGSQQVHGEPGAPQDMVAFAQSLSESGNEFCGR